MKKIALIFPGIGYHTDKPLLYYSKKLAAKYGYQPIDIPYTGFPSGVKGNADKMHQCFQLALAQTEEILKDLDFTDTKILVLAKSIGTVVAAAYIRKMNLEADFIFYTPLEETFQFTSNQSPSPVFTGTSDPWVKTETIIEKCKENAFPITIIENANHSLETGDAMQDIEILKQVMEKSEAFMKHKNRPRIADIHMHVLPGVDDGSFSTKDFP